jgi:hypothetical protein
MLSVNQMCLTHAEGGWSIGCTGRGVVGVVREMSAPTSAFLLVLVNFLK